ncbi:MAG: hypothetical protein WA761_01645 [Thermoplasmata archaeon]
MRAPTVGTNEIASWCAQWLRARPVRVLWRTGHLSEVLAVELEDGRQVVLKVRLGSARLAACIQVQRRLWHAGFPCPEPLAGPSPLAADGRVGTAEALVVGGGRLALGPDSPHLFAEALERLVRSAAPYAEAPSLSPSPPWFGGGELRARLWPQPPDRPFDLNSQAGPPWLDETAQRARARLGRSTLPLVVGHADWESQDIRWKEDRLHVVHDWDSVVAGPEAVIAGAGAAAFPAEERPTAASIEDTTSFLAAYEVARGRPWSAKEREIAWAAGLWLMAYNAKIETIDDGPSPVRDRLVEEAEERLRFAGA